MEERNSLLSGFLKIILWIIRIWSLLLVSFIVILFLGEEVFNDAKEFNIHTLSLITGILMLGGLIIAWKWEITGGSISMLGFIGVQILNEGNSRTPIMYFLFALPAVLYILCGIIRYFLKDKTQ